MTAALVCDHAAGRYDRPAMTDLHDPASHAEIHDRSSERAQAFIYGTITALVATAGIELAGEPSPAAAGAIVVASAIVTWLAHSYSTLIGRGLIAPGGRAGSNARQVAARWWSAMHASAPILYAAAPATAAIVLAGLGVVSLSTAIVIGNGAGIVVMGAASWAAARAHHASTGGQVMSILITTALGVAIVAVEIAVHHL